MTLVRNIVRCTFWQPMPPAYTDGVCERIAERIAASASAVRNETLLLRQVRAAIRAQEREPCWWCAHPVSAEQRRRSRVSAFPRGRRMEVSA